MIVIGIKPLSVNDAWKGRRFSTDEYKQFKKDVYLLLPKMDVPEGKLSIYLEFGFSNMASDWDNPIKPFVDILQTKYGFDDNRIYDANVVKKKIKKGFEYIKFELKQQREG